jgi:feruloyl esterase
MAAEPTVAYRKVLGEIAPLDPVAPPIRFEVNLPEQWNGKAVQYGGAGFNGVLFTGLDNPPQGARLDTPVPVARSFATWGTDSGHDNTKLPEIQAFALNGEALENYAFASYKKVRDAAIAIARAHYGMTPRRIYYYGGSAGGREGLTMAQRFPADFDGILSFVPAINFTGVGSRRNCGEAAMCILLAGAGMLMIEAQSISRGPDRIDKALDLVRITFHAPDQKTARPIR